MSSANTIARPYARAAFELARAAQALPVWSANLQFSAAVAADPQAKSLIGNPRLSAADLTRLFVPDGVAADGTYGNFLATLAANRRLAYLAEIAEQFQALKRESEAVLKVVVRTAVPIESAQAVALKTALRKRFQRDIELETAVDPTLIGGALIDAGETVIDGSVRGRLARMAQALAQ
jgi:F-type H+-transporting ATPase subunit delta